MHEFRVVFGDHDPQNFGSETFHAPSMSDALYHIASLHSREPVELWQDGEYLGRLELVTGSGAPFWQVAATKP